MGQILENRVTDLRILVHQRAGIAVSADYGNRVFHDFLDVSRRFVRLTAERLDGDTPFPHGAMDRAVDRLVLSLKHGFDLVVRPVDDTGSPGLFVALSTQL